MLGDTTDMPALTQVAALYSGKPGELSTAECTATQLPMVLIVPIRG